MHVDGHSVYQDETRDTVAHQVVLLTDVGQGLSHLSTKAISAQSELEGYRIREIINYHRI